jgi:hypothetical protein
MPNIIYPLTESNDTIVEVPVSCHVVAHVRKDNNIFQERENGVNWNRIRRIKL